VDYIAGLIARSSVRDTIKWILCKRKKTAFESICFGISKRELRNFSCWKIGGSRLAIYRLTSHELRSASPMVDYEVQAKTEGKELNEDVYPIGCIRYQQSL